MATATSRRSVARSRLPWSLNGYQSSEMLSIQPKTRRSWRPTLLSSGFRRRSPFPKICTSITKSLPSELHSSSVGFVSVTHIIMNDVSIRRHCSTPLDWLDWFSFDFVDELWNVWNCLLFHYSLLYLSRLLILTLVIMCCKSRNVFSWNECE